MNNRWNFYKENFLSKICKDSNFLLISASQNEISILQKLGYSNFSITFHDDSEEKILNKNGFELNKNLFKSDMRNMHFENESFDYVITNATIHHVDLPHKAVTEMYRISKKGVLIIESNDSLTMRLASKLKLASEFETDSVDKKNKSGGLMDTGVPNYVYRWTEREINKLLKSYDPLNINFVEFNYANDLTNIEPRKNLFLNIALEISKFFAKMFFFIFKKQQNCLSIFINKEKSKRRWTDNFN